MAMSGALANASATLTLDVNNFVSNAQRASDAAQGIQHATDNVTNSGFLGWVQQNEQALNSWGKGLLGFGALITGAFTVPIAAGTKAAWGYADSMQQSRVQMNAYVEDGEKVDQLMADLVSYSQSDRSGGLFFVDDLAAASANMIIYGAEADRAAEYTEVLARAVGVSGASWDDLNRVIGRVGSTGRITRDDFEMLTKMGYDLDDSVIGQIESWDHLFEILDQGIPADALVGQAGTIRAGMAWLQGAVLNLGAEFLDLDLATGKFMEGGLGWQMMRGIERLTDLMNAAAPAVGRIGSMFASLGRPIGMAIDLLIRLPQPIQTAMVLFTGALGAVSLFSGGLLLMLPRIASTVAAFQAFGGVTGILGGVTRAVGALRVAMVGLFMNPAMLAAIAAVAAAVGAFYVLYQSNFLGFGDAVRAAIGWVKDLAQAVSIVFGNPITNTATLDVKALLDSNYNDWVEMPDGTYKNAELGLTATGSGLGVVSWVANPDAPDGRDWTLTVDVDGDGVGDALTIIDSEDHQDGTYTLTAEYVDENDEVRTFTAWYDSNDGKTIFLDMDASETIQQMSEVEKAAGRANEMAERLNTTFKALNEIGRRMGVGIEAAFLTIDRAIETVVSTFVILDSKIRGFKEFLDAWSNLSWEDKLDVTGLGALEGPIQTVLDGINGIRNAAIIAKLALDALFGGPSYEPTEDGGLYDPDTGVTIEPAPEAVPDAEPSATPTSTPDSSGRSGRNRLALGMDSARVAASSLNDALTVLNPEILRSNDNFNTTASTGIPGYTSATGEADSATGAMASNMGTSFGQVASDATANFSAMQSEATSRTAALNRLATADTNSMRASVLNNMLQMRSGASSNASGMESAVAGSMLGMRTRSATQLALLASSASTQTSSMQRRAATNASSMRSSVAGSMLGMKTSAALQMGLMASSARTSGSQMDSGLTGWMTGARVRIVASMASMVQAVRNTGSTGYNAGHYAGSRIGEGMAAGMNAWLGNIRASANAMVAAASAAVVARAMISSPSRLFMQYGEYIGEGLEIGMRNMIPEIGRTADRMIDTSVPSPAFSTPIGHGGTQIIDNSTHTTEYIALTESDFQQLLHKSERGNQAANHLSDPDAYNYGGA